MLTLVDWIMLKLCYVWSHLKMEQLLVAVYEGGWTSAPMGGEEDVDSLAWTTTHHQSIFGTRGEKQLSSTNWLTLNCASISAPWFYWWLQPDKVHVPVRLRGNAVGSRLLKAARMHDYEGARCKHTFRSRYASSYHDYEHIFLRAWCIPTTKEADRLASELPPMKRPALVWLIEHMRYPEGAGA